MAKISDVIKLKSGYANKAAGVGDFIHLRANCYAVLRDLQNKVGVVR